MSTADIMRKALQLAKHQLGMPAEQAYCDHEWQPLFAHSKTLTVIERKCSKCHLKQRAETIWRDIK